MLPNAAHGNTLPKVYIYLRYRAGKSFVFSMARRDLVVRLNHHETSVPVFSLGKMQEEA
jgi:hypothetical protein